MRSLFILLVFAALFVLGCKKECSENCAADCYFPDVIEHSKQSNDHNWDRASLKAALTGEWELIKSEAGGCTIPGDDVRCDNVRLQISSSGTYKGYLDNVLCVESEFTVDSISHMSYPGQPAEFSISSNRQPSYLYGHIMLSGDYMICGGGMAARYFYKRIPR